MKTFRRTSSTLEAPPFRTLAALLLALTAGSLCAQSAARTCSIRSTGGEARIVSGQDVIELELIDGNILRVDVEPAGKTTARTLVMDPALKPTGSGRMEVSAGGDSVHIRSSQLEASFNCAPQPRLSVQDGEGRQLLEQQDMVAEARGRRAAFTFAPDENLYGMSGLSRRENGQGLLRNNGAEIRAGAQGEIGGPWFFTTHFGVLVDSNGGAFDTRGGWLEFSGGSREDVEYFVVAGPPMQSISGLARLTGRPTLPPKWTLGFLNSQWGSNEAELKQIAATYRAKHIPLDAFILDFDWKAWGEDNYGEWRWNSTSDPGNFSPDKFPDGASGVFAKQLREQGVKLAGILKPRILLYKKGSKTELNEAAEYAQQHQLWYPGEPAQIDYFTQRPSRDLDFSKEEARTWFWKHLEPAFDAGMIGWWNDEADITSGERGQDFYFDSFQFLNMGRALYDGQRAHSNLRVWSLNRSGYLGAQRYGFAEWSGDIQTGFQTMQHQRMRMLATLDLGQPHWSMDTGGFFGHPTAENYARWMEFAAFVPIDRVHGDLSERRQPWLWGPVAEAAATKAIRLRYELLPYIYSYERVANETGIGIVRPLFWAFPEDPRVSDDGEAWMFGDALLVSPVVAPGESAHHVYLPAGEWFDYFRGTRIAGGKVIDYPVDPHTWTDIPLFVRDGSILASESPREFIGQRATDQVTLDVFPSDQAAEFVYYDDDGETNAYEQGAYYRQPVQAIRTETAVHVEFVKPTGNLRGPLRSFLVRIHGTAAKTVRLNGTEASRGSAGGADQTPGENQWTVGQDRFGPVTTLRIAAGRAATIELR